MVERWLGFAMATEIVGPDQDVARDGATIHMSEIHGAGGGRGTIDLARMAMVGETATEFHAKMSAQGHEQPVAMKLKMTTAARP